MILKWFSLILTMLLIVGCSSVDEQPGKSLDEGNDVESQDENDGSNDKGDVQQENKDGDGESTPVDSTGDVSSDSPSKTPPKNDIEDTPPKKDSEDVGSGEIVPSVTYTENNGVVEFAFEIKNNADYLVNYYFDTSQRYDYQIRNSDGEIVQSFSKGKTFSKLSGSEPIKPGGFLIYKVSINNLPKGNYTANFVLVATKNPLKASVKFTIN
jgi:hypothetical protein